MSFIICLLFICHFVKSCNSINLLGGLFFCNFPNGIKLISTALTVFELFLGKLEFFWGELKFC